MKRSKDGIQDIDDLKFLRRRLAKQLKDGVLEDKITFPQLLSAMICIGRLLKLEYDLTKNDGDDSDESGSTVRKYEKFFASAQNGGRRRASHARSGPRLVVPDDDDDDGFDSGESAEP